MLLACLQLLLPMLRPLQHLACMRCCSQYMPRVQPVDNLSNVLLQEDKMQGVPLVVLANKQDLINALPAAEVR